MYFPGSPILIVEASFAEGVILETLALSILNYDSAVASAAARMVAAADGRPLAEMGSRRVGERSAVAAARAAYIAGFSATSNLEAGRTWGVPTMGTAAHAFTLLHDSEEQAFRAQVDAMGVGTTLLVDTYDIVIGNRDGGSGCGAVARGDPDRLGRPADSRRRRSRAARLARCDRHPHHRDQRPRRIHPRRATGRARRLLRRRHLRRHRLGVAGLRDGLQVGRAPVGCRRLDRRRQTLRRKSDRRRPQSSRAIARPRRRRRRDRVRRRARIAAEAGPRDYSSTLSSTASPIRRTWAPTG